MKLVGANPRLRPLRNGSAARQEQLPYRQRPAEVAQRHSAVCRSSLRKMSIPESISFSTESQGHLEYDFQVAPGADPSQAELQFDGASKLELSGGDLILTGERTTAPCACRRRRSTSATEIAASRSKVALFCAPPTASASRLVLMTAAANWSSIRCLISPPTSAAAARKPRLRSRSMATATSTLSARRRVRQLRRFPLLPSRL